MFQILSLYIRFIDQLNNKIGEWVSWLSTILVLIFCYDVVNRYVFNYSNPAIFELEWHLFALIFLLGAAYTLNGDRHVRVDVFYTKFSKKQQALVNLVGGLLFLIPFCIIIIQAGVPYVRNSYLMNESSSDPGGLPYRFLIKSVIIVGFVLLLLRAVSLIFKSFLVLANKANLVEKKAQS